MRLPIFVILALSLPTAVRAEDVGLVQARERISVRLESLQNLRAKFEQHEFTSFPDQMLKAMKETPPAARQHLVVPESRDLTSIQEIGFLRDRLYCRVDLTGTSLLAAQATTISDHEKTITNYTSERVEILYLDTPPRIPLGSIHASGERPACIVDLALGLRFADDKSWLTSDDVKQMDASILPGEGVLLQKKRGAILHQWIFDPKQEFALLKYRVVDSVHNYNMQEYVNTEFKKVDGVTLPTRIICKSKFDFKDGNPPFVTFTVEVSNLSYKLNDPENVASQYVMIWPPKTLVTDGRNHVNLKIDKAQVLTDADIFAAAQKKDEEKARAIKEAQDLLDKEGKKITTSP